MNRSGNLYKGRNDPEYLNDCAEIVAWGEKVYNRALSRGESAKVAEATRGEAMREAWITTLLVRAYSA